MVDPDGETEAPKDGTTSHSAAIVKVRTQEIWSQSPLFLLFAFLLSSVFHVRSPNSHLFIIVSPGIFACRSQGPPNKGQA